MKIYGYARVSTADQKLDRQLIELRQYVPDERNIITDKASGKNFDRRGYNSLVGTAESAPLLREGDTLVILSLDRLGRNYEEVKVQWNHITNEIKANIKVIDMPLLDTTTNDKGLDRKFLSDLILQMLSYFAEKERTSIKTRQRQGIDAMPIINGKRVSSKTGKASGRPVVHYPENWAEVYNQWTTGNITATEAMRLLKLKRTTFYKLLKEYRT